MLSSLFSEKFDVDTRTPAFTFQFNDETYGFYLHDNLYWIQVLMFLIFQGTFAGLTSVINYHLVVKQPKSSALKFLVGYGLLIPFWLLFPFLQVQWFQIESIVIRFCMAVITPTLSLFRVNEALFGFAPDYATKSLSAYAFYFGLPLNVAYDTKKQHYIPATSQEILRSFRRFLMFLFIAGMVLSVLATYPNYSPFGDPAESDWYSWKMVFNLRQQANNICYAIIFLFFTTAYGESLLFGGMLVTGLRMQPIMDNPIFGSSSPSDFWGRRWNILTHGVLKNGVYKPVRSLGGSRALAVFATFVASGLFHEWALWMVLSHNKLPGESDVCTVRECYYPPHGGAVAFMIWQAMLVALEFSIGHWSIFQHIGSKTFPAPLRTLLVILAGLPLAHWFCDPYIQSNFFVHGGRSLPLIYPTA